MRFWKSPFNKVVRSKEALFIGLLLGLVVGGLISGLLMPTTIKGEEYNNPIEICGNVEKVETVIVRFDGKVINVECTDGRDFTL